MEVLAERRLWPVLTLLLCVAAGGCAGPVPYPPMADSHVDVRARMLAHVGESLLPFWLEGSMDEEHGGFVTELKRDGSVRDGRKMLVAQARQVWAFSRAWRAGYRDPRVRAAAKRGMRFMRTHMWDPVHEGWYWQVNRDGSPDDMRKKTYGHAFVIYAGVEYYRAFDDPLGLLIADNTFEVLEAHAKDPDHPGYVDFMDRRWRPDPDAHGHVKTMNTHLHLMEALTELYLVTGEERHGERLREMLDILVQKCYLPDHGCCIDGFNYDWTPVEEGFFGERNRITSYGHNVEFAWLMQRTVQALGLPEDDYRRVALTMIDHALRYGWDEEAGALYYEGEWQGDVTNRSVEWWTQAENAIALDWAYTTTGDPAYLHALGRQVDWILRRQADGKYGGWYSSLNGDGSIESSSKASIWHAAYHELRACLNVGTGDWD